MTQHLGLWQMALAYGFVLVVLGLSWYRRIGRERTILWSSLRMTVQLVAAGFVLTYVLRHPHPLVTALIVVAMLAFAVWTVFGKFKGKLTSPLKRVIVVAMTVGNLVPLAYFVWVVVRPTQWYSPQYFVPLAGMIIGNAMTGISLGISSLISAMTNDRARVEEVLILGGTPAQASRPIIDAAFDTAIMPTLNNMVGMGIVFLPGMMTGQILSGVAPLTAIAYQIAIMLAVLGSVAVSVIMVLHWGSRTYFTSQAQLVSTEQTASSS